MRALAFIITILNLGFIAMAGDSQQPQSDADIRQKIVGTWIIDLENCKGTETYLADGRYKANATWNYSGVTNEVENVEGTWGVTNGLLTAQVPTARQWKDCKVIRVDGDELVLTWNTKRKGDRTDTTTQKRCKIRGEP
jgi:hypothetical protein